MASYDKISEIIDMSTTELVARLASKKTDATKKAFVAKVFDINDKKAEKMMDAYSKRKVEREGKLGELYKKL
jgi:hypothetical protein